MRSVCRKPLRSGGQTPAKWSARAFKSEPTAQLSLRADASVRSSKAAILASDHRVPFPQQLSDMLFSLPHSL